MYCQYCGVQLDDSCKFCPTCGQKVEREANHPDGVQSDTVIVNAGKNKSKRKWIIVISALAITVLAAIVLLVYNSGYRKTLNNYFKAYEENDPELMYSSVVAQYWIDYMNEEWAQGSAYDIIEEDIEDTLDDWNCGDNVDITYEIQDSIRATKEEVQEIDKVIYKEYARYVYDREDYSITDAYLLDISFVVKGNGNTKEFEFTDGLLIIKENGQWRIPRGHFSCSFVEDHEFDN